MTYTDPMPPPLTPTPLIGSPWDACDHCQAPLGERQRYCVACGARRAQADDPVARYFVTAARRARTSEAPPAPAPGAAPAAARWRAALVFALLPVVAALGVTVGRGSSNDGQQLVQALRAQKAPIVNIVGGGSAGAGTSPAGTSGSRKHDASGPKGAAGKVIAHTEYGTARQLTGAKTTQAQLDASKQALKHIVNSKGKAYVEAQRNLPDQIVIP